VIKNDEVAKKSTLVDYRTFYLSRGVGRRVPPLFFFSTLFFSVKILIGIVRSLHFFYYTPGQCNINCACYKICGLARGGMG